jgi:Uma2 family endonuclease
MAEAGVFEPSERIELIDGEVLEMAPQSSQHVTAIRVAEKALSAAFGGYFDMRAQGHLAIDERSEPKPNIAVVSGSPL